MYEVSLLAVEYDEIYIEEINDYVLDVVRYGEVIKSLVFNSAKIANQVADIWKRRYTMYGQEVLVNKIHE